MEDVYSFCLSTLVDFDGDVLEGGVVTAVDSPQDLYDLLHFGTLDLETTTAWSGCISPGLTQENKYTLNMKRRKQARTCD